MGRGGWEFRYLFEGAREVVVFFISSFVDARRSSVRRFREVVVWGVLFLSFLRTFCEFCLSSGSSRSREVGVSGVRSFVGVVRAVSAGCFRRL